MKNIGKNMDMVKFLFEYGVDMNVLGLVDVVILLEWVLEVNLLEVVEFFMVKGVDIGFYGVGSIVLFCVVLKGYIKMVCYFLKVGFNFNEVYLEVILWKVLYWVYGYFECLEVFLDSGVDIDVMLKDGIVVYIVLYNNYLEFVKFFILCGVNFELICEFLDLWDLNCIVFFGVVGKGNVEIVWVFLDVGVDIIVRLIRDEIVLYFVISYGNSEVIVRVFFEYIFDLNV